MTPVQKHGRFWFKRDDLFNPFSDPVIAGGKVRQCLALVRKNLAEIRKSGASLATATSVLSPQSIRVAAIAKKFGLPCIVGYGGLLSPKEAMREHPTLRRASELGAELVNLSKLAYANVLYSRLEDWGKRHGRKLFVVQIGSNDNDGGADSPVISAIADQVRNLPKEINLVAIPVGSGVTASAILTGLRKYRPGMRALLLQPFGYDRRGLIDKFAKGPMTYKGKELAPAEYKYVKGSHAYHKLDTCKGCNLDFDLDAIYEAKAFRDMLKPGILKPNDRVCFWVIGNTNMVREALQPKTLPVHVPKK